MDLGVRHLWNITSSSSNLPMEQSPTASTSFARMKLWSAQSVVGSWPWMSILYAGGRKKILKRCLSTLKMHSITLRANVCRRLKSSSLFFGLIFISKSHIYINYSPDTSTAPLSQMVTYSTIRGQKFITHREASVSQVVLP
jgi:hypothetical protein